MPVDPPDDPELLPDDDPELVVPDDDPELVVPDDDPELVVPDDDPELVVPDDDPNCCPTTTPSSSCPTTTPSSSCPTTTPSSSCLTMTPSSWYRMSYRSTFPRRGGVCDVPPGRRPTGSRSGAPSIDRARRGGRGVAGGKSAVLRPRISCAADDGKWDDRQAQAEKG